MRQYAEVAASHPDRISSAELTEAVLDEGARLERLVQGMLVLTRADEIVLLSTTRDVQGVHRYGTRELTAPGPTTRMLMETWAAREAEHLDP